MTHFFGIHDPGRAGGSWLARCFNQNPVPAGIVMLGEAHTATQLNFPHPDPGGKDTYDQHIIAFLKSQARQGRAATGMIKCFHAKAEAYMRARGGRFATLVRSPMELTGCWKGRRGWGQSESRRRIPMRAIGHFPPKNERENFACLLYEVRQRYLPIVKRAEREPLIRIEDLNRSVGGDGLFFQAVCEWLTQVPFPSYYVDVIRKWYLPCYHYPVCCIKNERGTVVGVAPIPSLRCDKSRMTWADDTNPPKWWNSWTGEEQGLFMEYLQETCEALGYNCTTSPGTVDVEWPMKGKYPWADAENGLEPIV